MDVDKILESNKEILNQIDEIDDSSDMDEEVECLNELKHRKEELKLIQDKSANMKKRTKILIVIGLIITFLVIVWLDGINVRDELDRVLVSSNIQDKRFGENYNKSVILFRFKQVDIEQWILIATTLMGIFGTYYFTKKNIDRQLNEERKLREISEIKNRLKITYEKRINRKSIKLRELNEAMYNLKNTSLYSEIQAIDGYSGSNNIGINGISIPLSKEEPNSNLKFIAAIKDLENKLNLTPSIANQVLIKSQLIEVNYIICIVELPKICGRKASLLIYNHGYKREFHDFLHRNGQQISDQIFIALRDSYYEFAYGIEKVYKSSSTPIEDLRLITTLLDNFLIIRANVCKLTGETQYSYDEVKQLNKLIEDGAEVVILPIVPLLKEDYIVHIFADKLYKMRINEFEMKISQLVKEINQLQTKKNSKQ